MKVVYIYKSLVQLTGMERILTDKMNYLSEYLGYDVSIITYEQSDYPLSYNLFERIKHLDLGIIFSQKSKYSLFRRIWMYFKMRNDFKQRLYAEIKKINPDVIVSTTGAYPLLDIIMTIPGTSKHVLESHITKAEVLKEVYFSRNSLLKLIARIYDCYMISYIKRADLFVTLTEQDKKMWKNIRPTTVIPNVLTLYPEKSASLDNKKIISAGRLEPQKGYDLLIKTWSFVTIKHPDWMIDVYGGGPCKAALQSQIKEMGLESSFILHNATSTIYDEYMAHSIYVMSSRYEGFGLVLTEAMSCGLPCISFNCPNGPSEIIKDGEDGLLVENGNIEKLADAICRLIEDEDERRRMGQKARKAMLRYSKDNIMKRWDTLFKSLN